MSKSQFVFRTIKHHDIVYWNELEIDENGNRVYVVKKGYYLASYFLGEKLYHIVSLNDVTSCVVRHKTSNDLFLYYEYAKKECDIKNQLQEVK